MAKKKAKPKTVKREQWHMTKTGLESFRHFLDRLTADGVKDAQFIPVQGVNGITHIYIVYWK